MKPEVIIDTSIWIPYFRRSDAEEKKQVDSLLEDGRALLTGIILSEILQGTRNEKEFNLICSLMSALPFCQTAFDTWVRAGRISGTLRRRGLVIPLSDSLIAAQAMENDCLIYTHDPHFQKIEGLKLYQPEVYL